MTEPELYEIALRPNLMKIVCCLKYEQECTPSNYPLIIADIIHVTKLSRPTVSTALVQLKESGIIHIKKEKQRKYVLLTDIGKVLRDRFKRLGEIG